MLNLTDHLRRLRVDRYEYVAMKVIVLLQSGKRLHFIGVNLYFSVLMYFRYIRTARTCQGKRMPRKSFAKFTGLHVGPLSGLSVKIW